MFCTNINCCLLPFYSAADAVQVKIDILIDCESV